MRLLDLGHGRFAVRNIATRHAQLTPDGQEEDSSSRVVKTSK